MVRKAGSDLCFFCQSGFTLILPQALDQGRYPLQSGMDKPGMTALCANPDV
jgi:hypothetical protein